METRISTQPNKAREKQQTAAKAEQINLTSTDNNTLGKQNPPEEKEKQSQILQHSHLTPPKNPPLTTTGQKTQTSTPKNPTSSSTNLRVFTDQNTTGKKLVSFSTHLRP
eukprot:8297459-Ditylum_brightwellii.AAC.2